MGMMDWLRRRMAGDEQSELVFDEGEETHFEGLDMRKAIDAHAAWIKRLNGVLAGEQHTLSSREAGVDNRCDLGRWLHSTGHSRFWKSPDYQTLLTDHKAFHTMAGEILRLHEAGRQSHDLEARVAGMKKLSGRVQLGIIRLFTSTRG